MSRSRKPHATQPSCNTHIYSQAAHEALCCASNPAVFLVTAEEKLECRNDGSDLVIEKYMYRQELRRNC